MDNVEIRQGDWREVLADVEPDAVITDAPYGDKVHAGQRSTRKGKQVAGIAYASWSRDDVAGFFDSWSPRTRSWITNLTSHDLIPSHVKAAARHGRYPFHPLPCILRGMGPRYTGDGPSSDAVYLMVSRPREKRFLGWGSLPGHYAGPARDPGAEGRIVTGGKPLWLMRAIIRDYTRPGDLICDPFAGGATTLIAAALEGRRAIGAELDAATFALALARIERFSDRIVPQIPGLDCVGAGQGDLFGA